MLKYALSDFYKVIVQFTCKKRYDAGFAKAGIRGIFLMTYNVTIL